MTEKCRPVDLDEVLVVKLKGDSKKHTKKKTHEYTYEDSEVYPDGQGKDQYDSISIYISWKCKVCGRVVIQRKDVPAPRRCKTLIEVEDDKTR